MFVSDVIYRKLYVEKLERKIYRKYNNKIKQNKKQMFGWKEKCVYREQKNVSIKYCIFPVPSACITNIQQT